jgi:hypothetical protein
VLPAVTLALAGALAVLCLFAVVHKGAEESSAITAAAETQLMLVLDAPDLMAGKNAAAIDEKLWDAAPTGAALKAEEDAAVKAMKVIVENPRSPSPHPRPHPRPIFL